MKRVLITGATGFVGRALCLSMEAAGWQVRAVSRSQGFQPIVSARVEYHQVNSINSETDWSGLLDGVNVVIHLAARVHVLCETSADPLAEFRNINTEGSRRLAEMAAENGVSRFIFLSSIGVNGKSTQQHPFRDDDTPCPHSPYAVSKFEAEVALRTIESESGMEVVVIRSPLVYGPNNPGNFFRLLKIASAGIPLPFGSINNRRSLIFLDNLVSAINVCTTNPNAAGQIYLVSDLEDISTPALIRKISSGLGHAARLFPCPIYFLELLGKLLGKSGQFEQFMGSLTIDSSKIRSELEWIPPFTLDQGISKTAEWFKNAHHL